MVLKLDAPISLDKFMHPKQAEYTAKLQDRQIRREIRNEGYLAGVFGHPSRVPTYRDPEWRAVWLSGYRDGVKDRQSKIKRC